MSARCMVLGTGGGKNGECRHRPFAATCAKDQDAKKRSVLFAPCAKQHPAADEQCANVCDVLRASLTLQGSDTVPSHLRDRYFIIPSDIRRRRMPACIRNVPDKDTARPAPRGRCSQRTSAITGVLGSRMTDRARTAQNAALQEQGPQNQMTKQIQADKVRVERTLLSLSST